MTRSRWYLWFVPHGLALAYIFVHVVVMLRGAS